MGNNELKYKPVFVNLGGDIEFNTVILTKEPVEKLNREIDQAISEIRKNKKNYCVDDVIEEIGKRVDLVDAERIGELCI